MRLTRREFLLGGAAVALERHAGARAAAPAVRQPLPHHRSPLPDRAEPGLHAAELPARGLSGAGEAARRGRRRGGVRLVPGQRPDLPDGHPAEARPGLGRRHANPERLSRRGDRQARQARRARGALQRVPRPHRQRRRHRRAGHPLPFGRRLAFGNLRRRRGARAACRQAVEAAAASPSTISA